MQNNLLKEALVNAGNFFLQKWILIIDTLIEWWDFLEWHLKWIEESYLCQAKVFLSQTEYFG